MLKFIKEKNAETRAVSLIVKKNSFKIDKNGKVKIVGEVDVKKLVEVIAKLPDCGIFFSADEQKPEQKATKKLI